MGKIWPGGGFQEVSNCLRRLASNLAKEQVDTSNLLAMVAVASNLTGMAL